MKCSVCMRPAPPCMRVAVSFVHRELHRVTTRLGSYCPRNISHPRVLAVEATRTGNGAVSVVLMKEPVRTSTTEQALPLRPCPWYEKSTFNVNFPVHAWTLKPLDCAAKRCLWRFGRRMQLRWSPPPERKLQKL